MQRFISYKGEGRSSLAYNGHRPARRAIGAQPDRIAQSERQLKCSEMTLTKTISAIVDTSEVSARRAMQAWQVQDCYYYPHCSAEKKESLHLRSSCVLVSGFGHAETGTSLVTCWIHEI
jgi:hypothetical protein